jgi:isoamylase
MSDPQLDLPQAGLSYPIGATAYPEGVNFSVYARRAAGIDLLLFDQLDATRPGRVISLDRQVNRTYDYWHVFVPGIGPGQTYAYRAHGPYRPEAGLRFDGDKVLLDPYGRGVTMPWECNRDAAINPGDNVATAMKSVVIDPRLYDWEGDRPLRRRYAETIIYEMHVRGFTRHPSSGVAPQHRGAYAGVVDKIPYLQALGITAVELLPVFQFDPCDAPRGRVNYWGYSPISFFAPHIQYSVNNDPVQAVDEFRDMVKALHRAGIEVILDVVYNHTAEGSHLGPTFCYRGLANDDYYILEDNPALYTNYSGTGNTLNGNNTIVRRMILDSLRYWVREMHVDGFRFDLASILSRDESGVPMVNPPILWDIEKDPVLAGTKLIAEAWDAGGLYQVGNFFGDHWKEWNGRFRDDVRAFVKSDPGMVEAVASRFFASPDIYGHREREPEQSVNFITSHDGFTLNDLVSYNQKHNLANGEQNRDGENHNLSWNCGYEGPTDDPTVERLRQRQIKNFLTITLLALGVPMLSMGDEVRRTQLGNNNAYCQDNEISWLDWTGLERHGDILRYVQQLTRLRLHLDAVVDGPHRLNLWQLLHSTRVQWHGVKLNQPDTSYTSHTMALTAWGRWAVFHLIFNAYWEPLTFDVPSLPPVAHSDWRRIIDTSLDSPLDFCEFPAAPTLSGRLYRAEARSVVVLACRRMDNDA